jgi:hypothetical protein
MVSVPMGSAERERVALLGGFAWRDQPAVRAAVRGLPSGTVVLLDDDPFDVQAAAQRQCRCSSLVAVVHRLPTSVGKRAVEARRERDRVLLGSADRVVVFGELAPDREATLRDHVGAGLPVERRR